MSSQTEYYSIIKLKAMFKMSRIISMMVLIVAVIFSVAMVNSPVNNRLQTKDDSSLNASQSDKEYKIEEKFISDRLYVGVRGEVKITDMHTFFETNFGATMTFVNSSGLTMAGMPSGLYWEFNETKGIADMAAAIPIEAPDETKPIAMRVDSDIRFFTIPAYTNLVINYYGPYEGIGEAHTAMDNYMAAKGYSMVAPVIEEYVTDPGTEPDPNKWLTVLYYPIKK